MSLQPGYAHPATDAVAAVHAALDRLGAANLWSLSGSQLAQMLLSLERAARRLVAAQVAAAAQAQSARVAEREGATSLPAWLKAAAGVPVGESKARLALHDALRSRPRAAEAFAAGDVGMHAAQVICTAMQHLPAEVPVALTDQVERLLVEVGRDEGTRGVAVRATEIAHRFAPDALEREDARQAAHSRLRLVQRHDGTVSVRGLLDKESGALAFAVLGPYAAPAPASDGVPDLRDAETRYAEAFVQGLRLASSAACGVRGEPPHLLVTVGLDALEARLGAAPGVLEGGARLSGAAARRLACDATLIPIVLGAGSEPIDVGRATRVVPTGVRRALVARDQGCAMPGCERPPSWCDAHHCTEWARGGATALRNLVLLCARHHSVVHHDGWAVKIEAGLPWFVPPAWLDPGRTPRLHSRYRARGFDP